MVQFVFTPWRDRRELFTTRDQFYPQREGEASGRRELQHAAVARVGMWMARGNCPHLVESTALLTAALLCDEERGTSGYAVRAAYSTAFSRYGNPLVFFCLFVFFVISFLGAQVTVPARVVMRPQRKTWL